MSAQSELALACWLSSVLAMSIGGLGPGGNLSAGLAAKFVLSTSPLSHIGFIRAGALRSRTARITSR
ncbi:hypothetical protein QBC41DRAFT_326527 [Cercophora samala]|uniref:Uncharacterized protein n=1 Tax=Cercophora samala TaxID=330535 RepID=A0AA39Z9D2_9PEZI|nr:hypothetical protein QBC41DRAFT_326527 [Cercophora samala]